MHYKNGREVHAGDIALCLGTVPPRLGLLYCLNERTDTCNARVASLGETDAYVTTGECLHVEDASGEAFVPSPSEAIDPPTPVAPPAAYPPATPEQEQNAREAISKRLNTLADDVVRIEHARMKFAELYSSNRVICKDSGAAELYLEMTARIGGDVLEMNQMIEQIRKLV